MKAIAKFLCLGALLAAIVPAAKADTTDQISFAGFDIINTTSGAVTFQDANDGNFGNVLTGSGIGIFAPFSFANTTTTGAMFNNFNYKAIATPFDFIDAVASPTLSAKFYITSLTQGMTPAGGLELSGLGYYQVSNNGVLSRINNGMFDLTTQGNTAVGVTFSDTNTINVTPEPNSLMLLGTGLVSTAGMLLRRRRNASVIA